MFQLGGQEELDPGITFQTTFVTYIWISRLEAGKFLILNP